MTTRTPKTRGAPTGAARPTGLRALVTGATGFIGSHLVRRLAASGWEVHAVLRGRSAPDRIPASVRAHRFDGTTEGMVELVGTVAPDVVFHLASLFIAEHKTADVTPLIESNLLFGTQLAEAMRVQGRTRLVNTGTVWQSYQDEHYNPSDLYAATKQAYEDVLRYFEEAAGLGVITLKICDSYGPDDPRPKLMGALRRAALEGVRLSLTDGRQELDLVHVDDIARAFEVAAERLLDGRVRRHERYVVRSGAPVSIRELVQLFEKAAGRPLEADWGARAYRAREVMRPPAGGETLPGWTPTIELEQGIRGLLGQPAAPVR
jgi:nucleoside-diphosphate-sugar epimerase